MNPTNKPLRWLTAIAATVGLALTACNDSDDIVSPAPNPDAPAVTTAIDSKTVSAGEAIDVAGTFRYGDKSIAGRSDADADVTPIVGSDGAVGAYIVNFDKSGWVIVSATRSYYPILAHSETGRFTLDDALQIEGLSMWIDETTHAIEHSEKLGEETAAQIALDWLEYEPQTLSGDPGLPIGNSPQAVACRARLKELNETYYLDGWRFTTLKVATIILPNDVYSTAEWTGSGEEYTIVGVKSDYKRFGSGPLLTTEWCQTEGFNAFCKKYDSNYPDNYPAGCVPVAMAQLMSYYKYPTKFDWDSMNDVVATDASRTLIAEIGNYIGVDYQIDKASANIGEAQKGFKYYGYSVSSKSYMSREAVFELFENHPICMFGENSNGGGHAWVCDGVSYSSTTTRYCVEYLTSDCSYNNSYRTTPEAPDCTESQTPYMFHHNWGARRSLKLNGWYFDYALPGEANYNKSRKALYVRL